MVHYGNHAEKRNLIDVFFNQDRGALVLLGFIPIAIVSWYMGTLFLSLPSIPYPESYLTDMWMIVGWNILLVALSVVGFYWFRYGGTLSHDNKPEWDTIPTVVKEDIFFARATVPDLCALETVYKHPLRSEYTKLPKRILMMPYTVLFPVNIKTRGNNSITLYMLSKNS